jgi:hypothetical protein
MPANVSIPASVVIEPENLQKNSQIDPITVFIELPRGYDVRDILENSLRLVYESASIGPEGRLEGGTATSGLNYEGTPRLEINFSSAETLKMLKNAPPGLVTLTVNGIAGGKFFSATDTIRLID